MKTYQLCVVLLGIAFGVSGCKDGSPVGPEQGLSVSPSLVQAKQGETICFTATEEVAWSARYGLIDSVGCYFARQLYDDTVVARSRSDSTKTAKALVRVLPPSGWPIGAVISIPIETYEGSEQVVHPDALELGANDILMTATPYPFGNSLYENPSEWESSDGLRFRVPECFTNPIVMPGASGIVSGNARFDLLNSDPVFTNYRLSSEATHTDPGEAGYVPAFANMNASGSPPHKTGIADGYLSDPDWVTDPLTGRVRLYFRQFTGMEDVIFVMESGDRGCSWSKPQEVIRGPFASIISPTVIPPTSVEGRWQLWVVDANPFGCNTQTTLLKRFFSEDGRTGWSEAETINLVQPGFVIWHIKGRYLPSRNEYGLLYSAYPRGFSCGAGNLFLALGTPDATTWTTFEKPVLDRSIRQFEEGVYRSTFLWDPASDNIRIWVSGFDRRNKWSLAAVRYGWTELERRLSSGQ